MASAITKYDATGLRVVHGTYTCSGGTATIDTGLLSITTFFLQATSDATAPYGAVTNGSIAVTGATAQTGYFIAFGI